MVNTSYAGETSSRGEAADPEDALPRSNQEDLPIADDEHKTKEKTTSAPITKQIKEKDQNQLNIVLKNQYVNRHFHHPVSSGEKKPAGWQQWAQGIQVNYISSYAYEWIGLDASVYGGLKLNGNNPQNAPDQLLYTRHKNNPNIQYDRFYSRFGRLNVKFHAGNESNYSIFRYGLIGVDTALFADSNSRLLPSSFRGASFDASLASLDYLRLYGFYVDRLGNRAGKGYDRLTTPQNNKYIDNIQIYGAGYVIDNLGGENDYIYLNGEYGNSHNYTKHLFGQISYNIDFNEAYSLLANLQYRTGHKAGNLWDSSKSGYDRKAENINANLMSSINHITVALSYSRTAAKNDKSTGMSSHQFNPMLSTNDYGKANYWTFRQVSGFNYDQEKAYQLMLGYDFDHVGIKGFKTRLTHTIGDGINKAVGIRKERETDLNISYDFQHPIIARTISTFRTSVVQ